MINDNGSASSSPSTLSGLDEDAENQFQLELCWCIQQYENSLQRKNLPKNVTMEIEKSMRLLMSNTVTLVRKRQIMRNEFGDYRAKMAKDLKVHGNYVSNAKFCTPSEKIVKRSVFIKKAAASAGIEHTVISNKEFENGSNESGKGSEKKTFCMNTPSSGVPFKFNFSAPDPEST